MEALRFNSRNRASRQAGFSMIELLIATAVLSIGLLSLAGLMSKTDVTTHDSRYVSVAALLCSEKLEELSAGTPSSDVSIQLPPGVHSRGNLTADNSQVFDDGTTVGYYDWVTLSAANGSISETQLDVTGQYYSIKQDPSGSRPQQDTTADPPAADQGTVTFRRRWIIENSVPGLPSQVRRITVRVEYPTGKAHPGQFQMSTVRNGEPQS